MHTCSSSTPSLKMPAPLHPNSQENSVKKPQAFIQTIPFWVMFLSIAIFIFKYYFVKDFNVSHSSIFNTTKFWFLVSNIIILVIAVDFGAFCSSSKEDLYKDYPKDDRYQPENDQRMSLFRLESHTPSNEQVKDIVVYEETKSSTYNKENNQIIAGSDSGFEPIANSEKDIVHQLGPKVDHRNGKNDQEKKKILPCRHLSMSDGDAAVVLNDHNEKKMNFLYRSKTENSDANAEDNEFSRMSNEEVNKRVEEFIKRCNRQIRLEAVTTRFQEDKNKDFADVATSLGWAKERLLSDEYSSAYLYGRGVLSSPGGRGGSRLIFVPG